MIARATTGGHRREEHGFAALLTIVIVSAAALTMSFGAALLGLGELDQGYTAQKGGSAFALTEGCLETALVELRRDTNYNGATLTNDEGSCRIVVSGSGDTRTIAVEGDVDEKYYAHLTALAALEEGTSYPTITITDWSEVAE